MLLEDWSIGIYAGASPMALAPAGGHPVLTAAAVTDIPAAFVADPFMLPVEGGWMMFFEAFHAAARRGEIGLATSPDGRRWTYERIVLREPFHLSYPYVFAWQGAYYMTPETLAPEAVRLYRATDFPGGWEPVATLVEGRGADPSPFFFDGRWWLFVCLPMDGHATLRLFYADAPHGPWHHHPQNPIRSGDPYRARPAGRVLVHDGRVVRFAQTCAPSYGLSVRAFTVTMLTPDAYAEAEHPASPLLEGTGHGWNAGRMHHLDAHHLPDGSWLACVDGHPF